jgi:hypothetical protein
VGFTKCKLLSFCVGSFFEFFEPRDENHVIFSTKAKNAQKKRTTKKMGNQPSGSISKKTGADPTIVVDPSEKKTVSSPVEKKKSITFVLFIFRRGER